MKSEHTAIVNSAEEGGYWATCPEVPGANGQGETVEEAKQSLGKAIEMITESLDRLADQITPENLHGEVNWGGSEGKELW